MTQEIAIDTLFIGYAGRMEQYLFIKKLLSAKIKDLYADIIRELNQNSHTYTKIIMSKVPYQWK